MATVIVRNLPDDVHRALRVLAAEHGRSLEAELREILTSAVKPAARIRMGDALAALGRDLALSDEDFDALEACTDKIPALPLPLPARIRASRVGQPLGGEVSVRDLSDEGRR